MTEKAREIVTAKGRPSGTATTTIVMEIIKKDTKLLRVSMVSKSLFSLRRVETIMLMVIAMNVRTLTYTPILPISFAIVSSLHWRGVSSSSMFSFSSAIPDLVFDPTAKTRAVPSP